MSFPKPLCCHLCLTYVLAVARARTTRVKSEGSEQSFSYFYLLLLTSDFPVAGAAAFLEYPQHESYHIILYYVADPY